MRTKLCRKCRKEKDISEFGKRKDSACRTRAHCKECKNRYNRKYRAKNKEKVKAARAKRAEKNKHYQKEYYKSPVGKYKSYKSNAKKRNISFVLSFDEFMTFWKQPCYYCGAHIDYVGIDRLNNNVGYSLENCVPCCATHNYMKMELDEKQFYEEMLKVLTHKGIVNS